MADIAIFRINYKSDFILTLNSDAGWMIPFCIKFWTGAPSQAYFVGFDGTTYTHCAPVDGEPTKLRVQFDDHHLPIGDLKFQIGYHFTVADFPTSVEDEVINQASVIIEVDNAPAQVMLDFNGETAPEIEFSLPAYANEAQRIANEEQRIAHEAIRIVNEESRIAAETIRQQNEAQRIQHEEYRVSEFARLKHESEAATTDANTAATLANEKAALAADKAALAQAAADLANAKAQLAADKAALAQAAADLANAKAALAQQKAEYAQTQGDYAKAQGDYAKAQGDTAQADHERAESDHTRAESDHATAGNDHTQAGTDHTRAESDHATAAADHTQAGQDHTTAASDHSRAESDHTTASADHTQAGQDHTTAASDHTQAGSDHTRAESDHARAESDHAAVEVYVDSLGAFDISAYHATGGVLAEYADLTAALGTNGANIPDALRKGGMSVKFVQSIDNKYVQYRYTRNDTTVATFTNIANWQGEDIYLKDGGDGNLAITDNKHNTLAIFKEGHVMTKNFDSSKDASEFERGLMSAGDKSKLNTVEQGAQVNTVETKDTPNNELNISDENGNTVVKINNGHIKTKNFDSSAVKLSDTDISDFQLRDGNGDVLIELVNGGIRTKEFSSVETTDAINDIRTEIAGLEIPEYISAEQYNQMPVDKCNYDKTFHFATCTIDKGNVTRTYEPTNYIAKIALFGDLHVGYGYSFINNGGYGWKNWEDYIELSLKRASNKIPDFGIPLGDILSSVNKNMQTEAGIIERNDWYNRNRQFNYPLFNVFGNHDEAVPDFIHNGVIEIKNVRIIVFHMDIVHHVDFSTYNMSDADYTWLENAVKDSYNNGFITILASHYPIIGVVAEGNVAPSNYFGYLLVNNHGQDLIDLCKTYNVRLHIHGHNHPTGLPYKIMNDNGVNFDMTEVEIGLGVRAYTILEIRNDGFHFTEYPLTNYLGLVTEDGVRFHTYEIIEEDTAGRTLFVPLYNQESGTVRSNAPTPYPGVEHE